MKHRIQAARLSRNGHLLPNLTAGQDISLKIQKTLFMPVARHDLCSAPTPHQRNVVLAESLGNAAESSGKLNTCSHEHRPELRALPQHLHHRITACSAGCAIHPVSAVELSIAAVAGCE